MPIIVVFLLGTYSAQSFLPKINIFLKKITAESNTQVTSLPAQDLLSNQYSQGLVTPNLNRFWPRNDNKKHHSSSRTNPTGSTTPPLIESRFKRPVHLMSNV